MIEKLFAGVVLAVCIALLLRMLLRPAARRRLDRACHAAWRVTVAYWHRLRRWPRARRAARREAAGAIDRARRAKPEVDQDGNVYRPRSFTDRPRKDRRDH